MECMDLKGYFIGDEWYDCQACVERENQEMSDKIRAELGCEDVTLG